ncbi:MAG: ribosome silencing factor [Candidatus Shikimatogenerans bostrichidophilus]|nr:MAG: ribosome silencing factor [Candidatus Shikimatogenerans bostrichidophilus]
MKIYNKKYLLIKKILKIINKINAKKIKLIDIRNTPNNLFNFLIICNGKSTIHIKNIYNKIIILIKKKLNILPYNIEGVNNLEWVLIDYNHIIINIFLKKIRKYYNIDSIWENLPKIKIIKFK